MNITKVPKIIKKKNDTLLSNYTIDLAIRKFLHSNYH